MDALHKVSWNPGISLTHLHFIEQDRTVESIMNHRFSLLNQHLFGLSEYVVKEGSLAEGLFQLEKAGGILPGGTCFHFPLSSPVIEPLAIEKEHENHTVALAFPKPMALHNQDIQAIKKMERFVYGTKTVCDLDSSISYVEDLDIALPLLRYVLLNPQGVLVKVIGSHDPAEWEGQGFYSLPIAHILRVDGKHVELDPSFVPPLLNIHAWVPLVQAIEQVFDKVKEQAHVLSERYLSSSSQSFSVIDLLMLQSLNKIEAAISSVLSRKLCHPQDLHFMFESIIADLSIFYEADKRVRNLPAYNHNDIKNTLMLLFPKCLDMLNSILYVTAEILPKRQYKDGFYSITVPNPHTLLDSSIVFEVSTTGNTDELKATFAANCKIGSQSQILDLVKNLSPGEKLLSLSASPRQLPMKPNSVYFELEKVDDFWQSMIQNKGFAFHVGGVYEGFTVNVWRLRL